MAVLTVNTIARAGSTITYVTPTVTVGDQFVAADDQRHAILVKNGSGAPINVTVTAQTTQARLDGAGVVTVSDIVTAVAAGADAIIPVMPDFIKTNDGKVQVLCSAITTVLIAAVRLPRLA